MQLRAREGGVISYSAMTQDTPMWRAVEMDEDTIGQGPANTPEGVDYETMEVRGVPIFRAGKYEPQGVWTADDLDKIARAYDPAWEEAPVTFDHVQEGPALGWVSKVYRVGDELLADLAMNWPGFFALEGKMFKRRSVELFRSFKLKDGSTAPYLRAVSLLGAASPAVKGMRNIFSAMPSGGAPRQFAFASPAVEAGDGEVVRCTLVEIPDAPGRAVSLPPVGTMIRRSTMDDITNPTGAPAPVTASATTPDETAAFRQRAEAAEAEATETRRQFADAQARIVALEEVAAKAEFNDRLRKFDDSARVAVQEGRVTPAQVADLRAVFSALASGQSEVKFGKETFSPADALCRFMANSPALVPVGSVPVVGDQLPTPPAITADPENRQSWSDAVAAKADELVAANPSLDIYEATVEAERLLVLAAK